MHHANRVVAVHDANDWNLQLYAYHPWYNKRSPDTVDGGHTVPTRHELVGLRWGQLDIKPPVSSPAP